MKKTVLLFLLVFLMENTGALAGEIFVAPGGCDTNPGTKEQPLHSLQNALKMAREWRRLNKKEAQGAIRIHVSGGEYQLVKPLFIRPEDSGSENSPTVIVGEGKIPATISGGMHIGGWKKGCEDNRLPKSIRQKVWVAEAPMQANRIVYCRQLWVNGKKAVRAQQGKYGELIRMKDFNIADKTITIPTPTQNLKDAKELEMFVHQRWAVAILRVKAMNNLGNGITEVSFHEPESQLEFSHPWPQPVINGEKGNSSFCLVNAMQLLDSPGEWYQDYPSGKIYYLPREGEDMTTAECIVPVLSNLLAVDGTRERTVHNIQFENISFAHSAWTRPLFEGLVTLQAGFRMLDAYKLLEPGLPEKASLENQAWIARPEAAVRVNNASEIKFKDCGFSHLAATALDFEQGVISSQILGCKFSDIGGTGIMLGEFPDGGYETHVPYSPLIPGDLVRNITVADNEIYDAANEDWSCAGINAGYVCNTEICHNELHRLNYSGICVGWGWTPRESGMKNNKINCNYIHDFARQLYDVGGIYTLSNQPGSEMMRNRIEDIHPAPYATNNRAFYIYFDEATNGYTVTDNWMPDTVHIGYNQPGPDMKVKGNGPMVDKSIKESAGRRM